MLFQFWHFSFCARLRAYFLYDWFISTIHIRHHVHHRVGHLAEVRPCIGNLYFHLIFLFYYFIQEFNQADVSNTITVRTPNLKDGHLDLTDGHPTWRTVSLFERMDILFLWIVYMSNILSFKSNTIYQWSFSFYCLIIIIYKYFKRKRLPSNLKYNQKLIMNLFWRKMNLIMNQISIWTKN